MAAPDALLAAALVRDPAGPLLTFYDDATGERTELSATSLVNWVAKTANLLRDDVGAAPGDRVAVLLPAHWQAAAVLLGAWSAAAVVGVEPAGTAAAFAAPDRVAAAAGAGEVFAHSLAPLGRGFADGPPAGTRDYATEVRTQGDRWAGPPVADDAPALETADGTVAARRPGRDRAAPGGRARPARRRPGAVHGALVRPDRLGGRAAGPAGGRRERGAGRQPRPDDAAREGAGRAGDGHPGRPGARRPPPLTLPPPTQFAAPPCPRWCGRHR